MILILKRDDLPQEYRDRAIKDLELNHSGLAMDLTEKAELIVFVEGSDVKFLKHFPGIQSRDRLDVLQRYITSTAPTTGQVLHLSKKRIRWQKKTR
jgi:hypothetical protein